MRGGGFADFINGVASKTVLVEPNNSFAAALRQKGYEVFSYPEDALYEYREKADVITSFDVIEHVNAPQSFLKCIFDLLKPGGRAYIGTPTDYPVLRQLLGDAFNGFVFSVQHPWVFSAGSLEFIARKCGFASYKVTFHQLYGLGNMIAWLTEKEPRGDKRYSFISESLDRLYKSEMAANENTAEYLVLEARKG